MRKTEAIAIALAPLLTGAATTMQAVAHRAPPHRKAPRLPRATPIALQIGDLVTVNGQLFLVSAALIPTGSTPPPPPPPPPPLAVNGVLDSSRRSITSAFDGTVAIIQGTGFGTSSGAVTVAGLGAGVTRWTDAEIAVVLPKLPSQFGLQQTGPIVVTVGGQTAASPFPFTLTSSQPPPPPPPPGPDLVVFGYRDGQRNPAQAFLPGTTVIIQGANFGTAVGTVKVNNQPVPTQKWTDTELEIVAPVPALSAKTGPVQLEIRRPDGKFYASLGFTLIAPPGRKVGF